MKCPYCEEFVAPGTRFCNSCGAELSKQSMTSSGNQTLRTVVDERRMEQSAQMPTAPRAPHQSTTSAQQAPASRNFAVPQAHQPSVPQSHQASMPQSHQASMPQSHQIPASQNHQQGYGSFQAPAQNAMNTPGVVVPAQGPAPKPKRRKRTLLVVFGVAAVVLVAGVVIALVRGVAGFGGSQQTFELTQHYVDGDYGYSFYAPDNAIQGSTSEAGQIALRWEEPYDLWVNTYTGHNSGDITVSDIRAYLEESYDATVLETGSNYVITQSIDPDGDTNLTMVYIAETNLQYMDVYFHPQDAQQMEDVAHAIIESFTIGEGTGPAGDELEGDLVPVEIDEDLFTTVTAGSQVADPLFGFSVTAIDDEFSQIQTVEGSISLTHSDPQLYISCYGEENTYDSLEGAYEAYVDLAASDMDCSEATYNQEQGYFTYTETNVERVSLYKVYVGDSSTQTFVAMYDRNDSDAETLAQEMADTFSAGRE